MHQELGKIEKPRHRPLLETLRIVGPKENQAQTGGVLVIFLWSNFKDGPVYGQAESENQILSF